jgi:hypothetical protein
LRTKASTSPDEEHAFRKNLVLKKLVQKFGFKSLPYINLSFRTKASTSPDELFHIPPTNSSTSPDVPFFLSLFHKHFSVLEQPEVIE